MTSYHQILAQWDQQTGNKAKLFAQKTSEGKFRQTLPLQRSVIAETSKAFLERQMEAFHAFELQEKETKGCQFPAAD